MKLVLVNAPGINILPPLAGGLLPTSSNQYLKVTAPATVKANITLNITTDLNNSVDNMAMCTQIDVSIVGTIGEGSAQKDFTDNITLIGSYSFTTVNNKTIILMGDKATTLQLCQIEVISCGQTSTFAE